MSPFDGRRPLRSTSTLAFEAGDRPLTLFTRYKANGPQKPILPHPERRFTRSSNKKKEFLLWALTLNLVWSERSKSNLSKSYSLVSVNPTRKGVSALLVVGRETV